MSDLLKKFQPIDFIASITIVGGLILTFFGINGLVGTLLTAIVLFYFGKKEISKVVEKRRKPNILNETVEEIVRRIAEEEGVDPDLAVRVANCESGLNPLAKNRNPGGSVDRGLFQWNSMYHPEISDVCAYDIECSSRAFCKALKGGNLYWWNASKKCWKI